MGCAQSDSLPLLRAEVLDPCSSHGCHRDVLGLQGLAGLWMLSYIEGPPDIPLTGHVSLHVITMLGRVVYSSHRQGTERLKVTKFVKTESGCDVPGLISLG